MSTGRGEFEGLLGDARPLLADERSFCTKESAPVVEITGNAVSPGRGAVMEGSHRRQSAGALLKSKQAAEYLAISVRQLQYLSERQEVAVIEMGKNCVRYDRADLDDYIDRRRRPCRKEVTHG